ncbi:platelet endothelial aggregation receptor 1-like isoform X2 [Watersipora subatra]|uniref:platelet endothelial aggregation receptor 1-like isoform X2 n=1 Tax=Watersipora subatra TaxID=2589382 RepID=UPI00355C7690
MKESTMCGVRWLLILATVSSTVTTGTPCSRDPNRCTHGQLCSDVCTCDSGWIGSRCDIEICSTCDTKTEVCSDDGTKCLCKPGYVAVANKCIVDCSQCKQEDNYLCTESTNTCECLPGYKLSDKKCEADCKVSCTSPAYRCDAERNTCHCEALHIRDQLTGVCERCNSSDCVHGCMTNGNCDCQHPWAGEKCDFNICSRCDQDTEVCSKLSGSCNCKPGFLRGGDDSKCHRCNSSDCVHGCMTNGNCDCQHPWSGEKCDFNICSRCDRDTEVCSELSGSCDCKPGFLRGGDDSKCHINCDLCESKEHYQCYPEQNTCDCATEYKLDEDRCVFNCELCKSDEHYQCNTDQTACVCTTGYIMVADKCVETKPEDPNSVEGNPLENEDSAQVPDSTDLPDSNEVTDTSETVGSETNEGRENNSNEDEDSEDDDKQADAESPLSTHFLAYFLVAIVVVIVGYVLYHNRKKFIGLVVEGSETRKRRGNLGGSHDYKRLEGDVPASLSKGSGKTYIF